MDYVTPVIIILSLISIWRNPALSLGTTVPLIWGRWTVGYNMSPVFLAYICSHFGKLPPLKVCRISY